MGEKQVFQPLIVLANDLVLASPHRFPVDFYRTALDSELCTVPYVVINFRVEQQGLGGNAANIQTGASQSVLLLDHRGPQTPLSCPDRRYIAARAASQYYQIELVRHRPTSLRDPPPPYPAHMLLAISLRQRKQMPNSTSFNPVRQGTL